MFRAKLANGTNRDLHKPTRADIATVRPLNPPKSASTYARYPYVNHTSIFATKPLVNILQTHRFAAIAASSAPAALTFS
jgi:hypothetical protein